MLTLIAHEPLGILLCLVAIMSLAEVLGLCLRDSIAGSNGRQLSLADAPRKNLVGPGRSVEIPLTGRVLIERDRKRKIVCTNLQHLSASLNRHPAVHLTVRGDKVLQIVLILHGVSRKQDVFAL